MDFTKEIENARKLRADKVAEEARLRAEADTTVERLRGEGVNPLTNAKAFEEVDAAYLRADTVKGEIAGIDAAIAKTLERVGETADLGKGSSQREAQDVAMRFIQSAEIAALRESGRLNSSGARVDTAPVEVLTREEFVENVRLRTTVDNTSGSGGGLIWSDRLSAVVGIPLRRVRFLDLISIDTTDSDTIEYARETTHTDAAAGTAFGTALPESAYGFTKDSTTVKRVGHWVPATKGALADAGQLRGILNRNLLGGYGRELERQVWTGSGSGEELLGFLNNYGGSTQAVGSETYGKYTIAFHKALTLIRLQEIENEPSAMVIHPAAWEKIVLEQDSQGNFLLGRNANGDIPSLWGMVPVITTLAASGTAVLGDWSQVVLWVREGVTVSASDSHSDFFLKGLVAVKAEGRNATAVMQKKAFCKVTGL